MGASLAGLRLLEGIGTIAEVAVGHSLGELVALHWAGHYDADALVSMARTRGRVMAARGAGAMAAIAADGEATAALVAGRPGLHVANLNTPRQTVVSGDRGAVEALVAELRASGITATMVKVGHAFHTPVMVDAGEDLARAVEGTRFEAGRRPVVSTVTAEWLPAATDVISHLRNQCVSPVRFEAAASRAAAKVDLLLEVGPGRVLAGMLGEFLRVPVLPLDIGGPSLKPFLAAAGAAYVAGAAPSIGRLYHDRFARPFNWTWNPGFLANPCEVSPAVSEARPDAQSDGAPVAATTLERLRQIVAGQTGLPAWTIQDSSRMLSDLHLNSITVGEIVGRLVQASGLVLPPVDPTEYADVSVSAIAEAIDRLASLGAEGAPSPAVLPDGIGHWVRSYAVTRRAVPATEPARELGTGGWEAFGPGSDGAGWIVRHLDGRRLGSGVVVWMGRQPDPSSIEPLVGAAQRCAARAKSTDDRLLFVVVQPGWGGGGFARSWYLEEGIDTLVINVEPDALDGSARLIAEEIRRRHPCVDPGRLPAFTEVFLERDGTRTEPQLGSVSSSTTDPVPLGAGDVVLVTGGGRGISAECALQLAQRTGCALLVLGRSSPETSPELGANLERFRQAGVRVSYQMADVTDAAAVASAVAQGVGELGGQVAGVVHGAGTNQPRLVRELSAETAAATLAPKVDGLRNVLASVATDDLRLLVTFGSIIARLGLRGEADYALANEWLSKEVEAFQAAHPACRCRSIEWSLWSGTGMGQRLGRVEALVQQGISPISVDEGIEAFQRLIDTSGGPVTVVVTGRFGTPPTIRVDRPDVRQLRFVESVPVYYPGVELVAECRLSPESDPYLDDHVLGDERLLPAVMALEAMAEAAVCATDATVGSGVIGPTFRDVRFMRAIVVGRDAEGVTLRVAALVHPNGEIALAVRSSATSFRINHVEATAVVRPRSAPTAGALRAVHGCESPEPARALYRTVLFQTGRFERVAGFSTVEARRCEARLSPDGAVAWFTGDRAGSRLLLGDPGARDGALHAIQACIPHKVVIPTAVGVIETGRLDPVRGYRMSAREVADRGDELVYDLTIEDGDGQVVERWTNVTLRVVGAPPKLRLDSPALMAPFLERRVAAIHPGACLRVALARGPRRVPTRAGHRPDGKPDPADDRRLRSVAYDREWKLDVRADVPTGCDVESVEERSAERWATLLGQAGLELAQVVADLVHEKRDVSATRIWTAREALKKAGASPTAPLVVDSEPSPCWTVFRSDTATVFSSLIEAQGPEPAQCVAIALRREPHG